VILAGAAAAGQCGQPDHRTGSKESFDPILPGMEHPNCHARSLTTPVKGTYEDGMSYCDKQSRIRFAVSASFVIFCSTVSNALPTQAITEEVKACKAISNDQQRLKCFDDLFADKPNPPSAADKSANEGNWSIEESKSPTDGSPQIVAANLVGDTVLILRCKDQTTEAAFSTEYNYLGYRSVDVQLRINDQNPIKEVWKASMNGRAAFAPDAVAFIQSLPDNGKLSIRTIRSDGKVKEGKFNLGAISEVRNKIAHACDWDDTPNEPVGSVDHSEHR
jgi:hypothetical protein